MKAVRDSCGIGLGIKIGPGIEEKIIRPLAADDETLLAVDQEIIPAILGFGRGAEKIRSAPWFGQAFRGENISPEKGLDILFLLFVRSVLDDGVADQFRPDPEDAGEFITQGSDLFHDHAGGDPVHFPAAPFPGIPAAHEVPPPGFAKEFLGKFDLVGIHVEDPLFRHPLDEFPHFIADFQLFLRKQIIEHRRLPCVRDD